MKLAAIVVLFAVVIVGGSLLYLHASACDDTLVQSTPSPDGEITALVIERNCGATTDYVRRLVLQPTGLLARFKENDPIFVVEGAVPITVMWSANSRALDVTYVGGIVIQRLHEQAGIRIGYPQETAPALAEQSLENDGIVGPPAPRQGH